MVEPRFQFIDLSQRLSGYVNTGDDEAIVVQKLAKIRGVLACYFVFNHILSIFLVKYLFFQ